MLGEIIIALICIQIITVFIIDMSGAVNSLLEFLSKIVTKGRTDKAIQLLRPFTCSLCMNFYLGLLFLFISGYFSLPYITIVCILSLFVLNSLEILNLFKDIISKVIRFLYEKLHLEE